MNSYTFCCGNTKNLNLRWCPISTGDFQNLFLKTKQKILFLNSETRRVPRVTDEEFGICAYFPTVASLGQGPMESSGLLRIVIVLRIFDSIWLVDSWISSPHPGFQKMLFIKENWRHGGKIPLIIGGCWINTNANLEM